MYPTLQTVLLILAGVIVLLIILHFVAVYFHWRRYCKKNGVLPYWQYWKEKWLSTF